MEIEWRSKRKERGDPPYSFENEEVKE